MTTFLALYRGATIGEAQIIAVSADASLIGYVAARLLANEPDGTSDDPVIDQMQKSQRRALQIIAEMDSVDRGEQSR